MNNFKKARFKQTLFHYNQMYILVFSEEISTPKIFSTKFGNSFSLFLKLFSLFCVSIMIFTAWKVSVFEVSLVRSTPNTDTFYTVILCNFLMISFFETVGSRLLSWPCDLDMQKKQILQYPLDILEKALSLYVLECMCYHKITWIDILKVFLIACFFISNQVSC